MTRSLTIVNTSNWEHEDYEIRLKNKQLKDEQLDTVRLKPGEQMAFQPDYVEVVSIHAIEEQDIKPFEEIDMKHEYKQYSKTIRGTKQVIPKVTVTFE